eukprot:2964879-Rhodomonas_salina.3
MLLSSGPTGAFQRFDQTWCSSGGVLDPQSSTRVDGDQVVFVVAAVEGLRGGMMMMGDDA